MRAGHRNKIFSNSNQLSAPGPPSDPVVPMLLDAAEKVGVKVMTILRLCMDFELNTNPRTGEKKFVVVVT